MCRMGGNLDHTCYHHHDLFQGRQIVADLPQDKSPELARVAGLQAPDFPLTTHGV